MTASAPWASKLLSILAALLPFIVLSAPATLSVSMAFTSAAASLPFALLRYAPTWREPAVEGWG